MKTNTKKTLSTKKSFNSNDGLRRTVICDRGHEHQIMAVAELETVWKCTYDRQVSDQKGNRCT